MNGEQFHSALCIAGNCLTMANEGLIEASESIPSSATRDQLKHVQETLKNGMVIVEALKHYLDAHPFPKENVLPFRHCL